MGSITGSRPCGMFAAGLAVLIAGQVSPSYAQSVIPTQGTMVGRDAGSGRVTVGVLVGAGVAAGALLLGLTLGQTQAASGPVSEPLTTPPKPVRGRPRPVLSRPVFSRTNPLISRSTPVQPRSTGAQIVQQGAPSPPAFTLPEAGENRFVTNEILLAIRGAANARQLRRFETRYGLTRLALVRIALLDLDIARYRIRRGASVPGVLGSIRNPPVFVASAQPNFLFELTQDPAPKDSAPKDFAPKPEATPKLDATAKPDTPPAQAPAAQAQTPGSPQKPAPDKPPQYAVEALKLDEAHRTATGAGVLVALIDTGLDETNPDIEGAVSDRFDAIGGPFVPLAHGTAMGGVIVAHKTLIGVAPDARLLAIRAFPNQADGRNGTGFDILRGLDYAASHGAKIVNMSFAGPEDALLRDALAAAGKRGITTVAAAGNAGPDSKPLFPGAHAGVIAVTATDAKNTIVASANRGDYVTIAAPGASVIAPGVGGAVQFTSGTSVAAAEISGIAALLLQVRSNATPAGIRDRLTRTAQPLSASQTGAGAGLANAAAAVEP